jgi:hypothetical protein
VRKEAVMRARSRGRRYSLVSSLCSLSFVLLASVASAQSTDTLSVIGDIAKSVALDPTTYAPAAIGYGATMRDWSTSQVFFRNGFNELNPRFTVTGRSNDTPLSYADGRHRILRDALGNLPISIVNNATDRLIEHFLTARHPEHKKLFRALGWIERLSFCGYISYQLSAHHFAQASHNERQALALGLR